MIAKKTLQYTTQSRDNWKQKAILANKKLLNMRKKLNYHKKNNIIRTRKYKADAEKTSEEIQQLRAENNELKKRAESEKFKPVTANKDLVYFICINFYINAHVSFRAVPRILEIFAALRLQLLSSVLLHVPHFTSVITWAMRVGLALLTHVKPCAEPWVALVDMSIRSGKTKLMVVLRVPLSVYKRKQGGAVTLQDCEVLAVRPRESWTAAAVKNDLSALIEVCEQPVAWVADGGSDLKKALTELTQEKSKNGNKSFFVQDIGHSFANILKKKWQNDCRFKSFTTSLLRTGKRLRQTSLAHLAPPKLRSKGRFQGISKVMEWGLSVSEFLRRSLRPQFKSDFQKRLKMCFGSLVNKEEFFKEGLLEISTGNEIQSVIKKYGINQKTWGICQPILSRLPEGQVREGYSKWLMKHLRIANQMGGVQLLASTDVLESLFGAFKQRAGNNFSRDFGRLILTIPLMCGKITEERVKSGLALTSEACLKGWLKENLSPSLLQKRKKCLRKPKKLKVDYEARMGRKVA